MLYPNEMVIHEANFHEVLDGVVVDGERKSHGLIPRNYNTHPRGCYRSAKAIDFPLIPQSDWSGIIKEKINAKSQLSDIRMTGNGGKMIPSLDQNGKGYCWAHSSTGSVIITRAKMNLPYVGLSAYAVACIIKKYQDEGGWGAESLDFITERGVPSEKYWPMQSMSRANDKPETWANALKHRMVEGYVDLAAAQYDRTFSFNQEATLLLSDCCVVKDENWWSHSILGLDLVDGTAQMGRYRMGSGKLATLRELEFVFAINHPVTGGFAVRILNSWGDSWSSQGMGVLTGNQAISDGAVAPRIISVFPD